MEYELKAAGNSLVVTVRGELDHHCADIVRKKIDRELMSVRFKNLIFDFSGLTFMDSSGIGMVMGRYKNVSHLGGKVIIVCGNKTAPDRYGREMPDGIERILEMSGIFKIIERCDSVEVALTRV